MARKTDGEKVDELEKFAAKMSEKVDQVIKEANALYFEHSETARALADLRREYEREIALLRKEIDDLKKDRERWGQRLWMVLAPLISGAAGMLLSYQLGVKK